MRSWIDFQEFKDIMKEAPNEAKLEEENTVRTDMTWRICVVSCRFLYKPVGGGLDRYESHIEASHFLDVNEVRISEGSTSNCNPFNPITGGFSKLPANSELNLVNSKHFCDTNFCSAMNIQRLGRMT